MRLNLIDKQKLLGPQAIEKAESKTNALFSKFGRNVKSIEITVNDINGPRGGLDKECLVVVKLRSMPDVVVKARDESLSKALNAAVRRAGRTVARILDRRGNRDYSKDTRVLHEIN